MTGVQTCALPISAEDAVEYAGGVGGNHGAELVGTEDGPGEGDPVQHAGAAVRGAGVRAGGLAGL